MGRSEGRGEGSLDVSADAQIEGSNERVTTILLS